MNESFRIWSAVKYAGTVQSKEKRSRPDRVSNYSFSFALQSTPLTFNIF